MMGTLRGTAPKNKSVDTVPTSEASVTMIKGVNVTSKADAVHVMEESVLQTTVVAVVNNVVPTRKWSSLEVTSVTISTPT
jgi:hypothetical protein